MTSAQVAFAWGRRHPSKPIPIIGTVKLERVTEVRIGSSIFNFFLKRVRNELLVFVVFVVVVMVDHFIAFAMFYSQQAVESLKLVLSRPQWYAIWTAANGAEPP